MTKEEKQQAVQNFLNYTEKSEKFSLVFCDTDGNQVKCYPETRELDYLVLMVIDRSNDFSSKNIKTGEIECSAKRRRSSLDIWRHAKYFNKEITLFDVMDSIWRQKDLLAGQFCGQVERRVFRLSSNVAKFNLGRTDVFARNTHDEYGLIFMQWKGINQS